MPEDTDLRVEDAVSPLAAARQALHVAEDRYRALGAVDTGLKQRERHLDTAILEMQRAQTLAVTVAEVQRWRAEEARLRDDRGVVKGERAAVYAQSQEASYALITATAHYREIEDQARAALRLLRARQAEAQEIAPPWAQAALLWEAAEAEGRLALVVGDIEAHRLADDPAMQPAWMRG